MQKLANALRSVTVTFVMQDRRFSPLLLIGFVIAAAGMALVGFFWLGDSSPVTSTPLPEPTKATTSAAKPTTRPDQPSSPAAPTAPGDAPPAATSEAMAANNQPASAEQRARESADQKIGNLLQQNPSVEGARDKLLLLFPGFTSYEKIAAAPHIVNLTGDEKLSTVVGFLKSPLTPPEAQETFFNDMLNRPPQVGWPVLVEVIATPNHPLAARAKELLTTIVGQDYGNDVFAWQRGLRDQLKQQGAIPDDTPPTANTTTPTPAPQQ